MKQIVSFDKLKLTNNQMDENGHVSGKHVKSFVAYSLNLHFYDHKQNI